MAPNPRRLAAKLDELYARLPHLECQGLCSDSCGPIPAGGEERRRMERAAGRELTAVKITQGLDGRINRCHECSMLENGRCSVYDIRPMICRLWGIAEDLKCPYGCVPEGGHIPVEESYAFLAEVYAIAGWPPGWERFAKEDIRALAANPEARRLLMNHHRPTLAGRVGSLPLTVIERGCRL